MTTTKERGIIFSGEMVRAILDGHKTVTRRLVKPQPRYVESSGRWSYDIPKSRIRKGCCAFVCDASRRWWEYLLPEQWEYRAGDLLYVRETWSICEGSDGDLDGIGLKADDSVYWVNESDDGPEPEPDSNGIQFSDITDSTQRWRPSIHMPKWAARIWLEVLSVRPERVCEITEEDARLEGAEELPAHGKAVGSGGRKDHWSFRQGFSVLWDELHGPGSWDANPWVWRVEFRRIERP